MPFLDDIVTRLNEEWLTSSLKSVPKGRVKTFGISETVIDLQTVEVEERETQRTVRFPAEVDDDGDARMIVPDDSFDVIFYHKLESIANNINPRKGFGDSVGEMVEVANMAVIVFAFRNKLRKSAAWLEAIVKDTIPDGMKLTDPVNSTPMQQSVFRIGNSSFDKLGILQREFSEVELNYSNLIVFETKYRIESTWKKGCFNKNCGC